MARYTGTPEEVAQQIVSQAKVQGAIRVTADVEYEVVQTSIFETLLEHDLDPYPSKELEGRPTWPNDILRKEIKEINLTPDLPGYCSKCTGTGRYLGDFCRSCEGTGRHR